MLNEKCVRPFSFEVMVLHKLARCHPGVLLKDTVKGGAAIEATIPCNPFQAELLILCFMQALFHLSDTVSIYKFKEILIGNLIYDMGQFMGGHIQLLT